jgi:hypothetical protein
MNIKSENGWRLYRIPINRNDDTLLRPIGDKKVTVLDTIFRTLKSPDGLEYTSIDSVIMRDTVVQAYQRNILWQTFAKRGAPSWNEVRGIRFVWNGFKPDNYYSRHPADTLTFAQLEFIGHRRRLSKGRTSMVITCGSRR